MIVGPLVAALAFVCSIGNIPLAAVLWSGGISFGGVIAFVFADLIILPIISAYRKYYGARFAALLTGVMFGAMVDRRARRRRLVLAPRARPDAPPCRSSRSPSGR